jgi:hypothetical protein
MTTWIAPDAVGTGDKGDEVSREPTSAEPRPRCDLCGEIVGVYERAIIETQHGAHETSLAREPSLLRSDGAAVWYHGDCYLDVPMRD